MIQSICIYNYICVFLLIVPLTKAQPSVTTSVVLWLESHASNKIGEDRSSHTATLQKVIC